MKSLRHATLRQLQIFETAAGNLSFARAAEQLHLTQPAISMQIAQLELSAGAALLANLLSGHRDLANAEHRAEVAALWGVADVRWKRSSWR